MDPQDQNNIPNGAQNTGQDPVQQPEIVDPRDLPQYKAYEAHQVAKSHLDVSQPQAEESAPKADNPESASLLADNPALRFSVNQQSEQAAAPAPEPTPQPTPEPSPVAEVTAPPVEPITETVAPPTETVPTEDNTQAEAAQPTVVDPVQHISGHSKNERILGLLLAILAFVLVLIGGFIVFLYTGAGLGFLASLGLDAGIRVTLISIVLGVLGVLALLGLVVGIVKTAKAPKDDKPQKKKGFALSILSGFGLLLTLVGFVIVSFTGTTTTGPTTLADYVITDPTNLINLTAPVTVTFDASQVPYDQNTTEILSYQWDFGDGGRATGDTVTHEFTDKPADGVYNVSLTIVSREIASGEQFRANIPLTVSIANATANVAFKVTPDFGAAPLTVEVDASATTDPDGEIVAYEWDFDGDEIIDDEGVASEFTYANNGNYKITLYVTDTNGQVTEASETVTVADDGGFDLKFQLSPDDEQLISGLAYQFDASTSTAPDGKIIAYNWEFSDGTPAQSGKIITHTFNNDGVYTLTLRVTTDTDKSISKEFTVQVGDVLSGPQAEITTIPELDDSGIVTGNAPLNVAFQAEPLRGEERERIIQYEWDFDGDNVTDVQGANARFVFENPGSYTAKLTVEDVDGDRNEFTVPVQVGQRGVSANLQAAPVAGSLPLSVDFDASSSTTDESDKIVTFLWNFGDGTPERRDNAQLTYLYKEVGTYTATVTAVTESGKTATDSIVINVNPVSLKSCFRSSRKRGPAPLIVEFNPQCAQGSVSSYQWAFGDGNESIDRRPVHTFEAPGVYTVTLTVESNNVTDTFTDTIEVE